MDEPRTGPVVRKPEDIRGLNAKFSTQGSSHFGKIRGDTGFITAAAGAKVAIMSRWVMERTGQHPDGTPQMRFRAQFSYVNEALMNMKVNGLPLKKRVQVRMKTKHGVEDVDIVGWSEWKFADGILLLEDCLNLESMVVSKRGVVPE